MNVSDMNERIRQAINNSIREGHACFYQIGRTFYICLDGRDSRASEEEDSYLRNLILHELVVLSGRTGEFVPTEKLISMMNA